MQLGAHGARGTLTVAFTLRVQQGFPFLRESSRGLKRRGLWPGGAGGPRGTCQTADSGAPPAHGCRSHTDGLSLP